MVIWVAFTASKCTKNRFSAEAPPRTTLMELTMLPRPLIGWDGDTPPHTLPLDAFGPRSGLLRRLCPWRIAVQLLSPPLIPPNEHRRTVTLLYRQPPSLLLFTRRLPEGTTARRAQRTDLSHFARSSRSGANTTPAVYRAYFTHRRRSAV